MVVTKKLKRPLALHPGQRTKLPASYPSPRDVSIWEIIKPNIGRDFSRFSVPVFMNEPISFLQRLSENTQYNNLLVKAAQADSEIERIELVTAFAVATASANYDRLSKPFNPMLLETFELERHDVRFLAEQVSHHPPISAIYAESEHYIVEGTVAPQMSFWMTRLTAHPHARIKLTFKASGDEYWWDAPKCTIFNVIMGRMYMNFTSNIVVSSSGDCSSTICFDSRGYGRTKDSEVHFEGHIQDGKTKIKAIYGNWTLFAATCDWDTFKQNRKEYIKAFHQANGDEAPIVEGSKVIWIANALPELYEEQFHFSHFSLSLNEMYDEMDSTLPPTDCRRRKDMKCLENGDLEKAEEWKRIYEQSQRDRKSNGTGQTAKWFTYNRDTQQWAYNGDYWDRDFDECIDIFEGNPE